jgi:hypothetical protein
MMFNLCETVSLGPGFDTILEVDICQIFLATGTGSLLSVEEESASKINSTTDSAPSG